MYSVLIVEDELLVSIGIKNMVNWAKLNMYVIGQAQDGKTAYEIYQKNRPDLILSDIKMPKMDGLQLISKIRESDKTTKIIILTGYDEFDLVHTALRLGVSDYILKLKMTPKNMEETLERVVKEIKKSPDVLPSDQGIYLDPETIKSEILRNYVLYEACSEQEFETAVRKLELRLNPSCLIFCIMKMDRYSELISRFDARHRKVLQKTILSMTNQILQKYQCGEMVSENEERYWLILSLNGVVSIGRQHALLLEIIGRIRMLMKTYINVTVKFAISGNHDKFRSLPQMYQEAMDALKQGYFMSDSSCVFYHGDNEQSYLKVLKDFQTFLFQLDGLHDFYRKAIASDFTEMRQMFGRPTEEIQEILIRWIHWPAVNTDIFKQANSKLALDYARYIRKCDTFSEAIELLKKYLMITVQLQNHKNNISKEVLEAMQYIKENYEKEISLQEVAGKVSMSGNYLSSLFRKELHVGFVEYVNSIRVEKAKELLLHTHFKSFEVAWKVGFTDESYFSRIFKKMTGLRPNEFKKRRIISNE